MAVKRYRITADVYAPAPDFERDYQNLFAEQLERLLRGWFPLGVVEGYPDIQEITDDSPFTASDAAAWVDSMTSKADRYD